MPYFNDGRNSCLVWILHVWISMAVLSSLLHMYSVTHIHTPLCGDLSSGSSVSMSIFTHTHDRVMHSPVPSRWISLLLILSACFIYLSPPPIFAFFLYLQKYLKQNHISSHFTLECLYMHLCKYRYFLTRAVSLSQLIIIV